jgi:prepilin-type N-terminal cleavage/methylation domain-containing protein
MMTRRIKPESGFSLIELLTVVLVVSVLTAIAVMITDGTQRGYKANAARDLVVTQLRFARELATSKRRNVRVDFTPPNQVQVTVQYLPGETPGPAIPSVYLNNADHGVTNGAQFYLFTAPTALPDTPMGFGRTQAINLAQPSGGGAWGVMFTTSGALVGTSSLTAMNLIGNSNPVNATIFIGIPPKTSTARAVTVLGATGRVRSYSWNGTQWIE